MSSHRLILIAAGLCSLTLVTPGNAAGESSPAEAISYVEQRVGAPGGITQRTIQSAQGLQGIDADSRVSIRVDEAALTKTLSASKDHTRLQDDANAIAERAEALRSAAARLDAAMVQTESTIQAYRAAELSGDYDAFRKEAAAMGATMQAILELLVSARRTRLVRSGVASLEAKRIAEETINDALLSQRGYDWSLLRDDFAEEIRLTEGEMASFAPKTGLKIDIRAHLIAGSTAIALPLPGYNTEVAGPPSLYPKIAFSVTDDEKKAFEQYSKMAEQIGKTHDLGEAFVRALEIQFSSERDQIVASVEAVKAALVVSKGRLEALGRKWSNGNELQNWVETVTKAAVTDDERLIASEIQTQISETREDLELLQSLENLGPTLKGSSPPDAMESLFAVLAQFTGRRQTTRALDPAVWRSRVNLIEEVSTRANRADPFAKALKSSGPLGELNAAVSDLRSIQAEIEKVRSALRNIVAQVMSSPAQHVAATLPVPKGQTRVDISQDADTWFDLKSQPSRRERDSVVVSYNLYHGEERIGAELEDEFVVRVFGWFDHTAASLAFVQQEGKDTWEPTGALSWILSRRTWPNTGEDGLSGMSGIRFFSGAGITMMPLNFVESESVELGIALTVSFLDNRLLIGYGQDLQAPDHKGYPFVSIRLLDTSGFIGNGIKGGSQ